MLVPFSMIVLGTQLVMTVADSVPKFYIARGCRVDSTQAFDLSTGQNETVKRCVADEQQALTQLQTQWPQFREPDKAQCNVESRRPNTSSKLFPSKDRRIAYGRFACRTAANFLRPPRRKG